MTYKMASGLYSHCELKLIHEGEYSGMVFEVVKGNKLNRKGDKVCIDREEFTTMKKERVK